jgi:glucuronate isomerase
VLFDRFRIEVLATTDAATDPLESHRAIRESGWTGRVIPTFRPDALFRIA